MRATSRDSLVGRDRDGELSEDTLQATIEKSKKVLALQRELLNQVLLFQIFPLMVNKSNQSIKT